MKEAYTTTLPQPHNEIAPKGYYCTWNSHGTQEEMSRRTPRVFNKSAVSWLEYLINQHMMRILNLQVQTKLTLHQNLFLTGPRAFFLKRQLGLTQR